MLFGVEQGKEMGEENIKRKKEILTQSMVTYYNGLRPSIKYCIIFGQDFLGHQILNVDFYVLEDYEVDGRSAKGGTACPRSLDPS